MATVKPTPPADMRDSPSPTARDADMRDSPPSTPPEADMSDSPPPTPLAADMIDPPTSTSPAAAADTSVSASQPAAPATSSDAAAAEPADDWSRWAMVIYTGDAPPRETAAASAAPVTEDAGPTVVPATDSPAAASSATSRSQAPPTMAGDSADAPDDDSRYPAGIPAPPEVEMASPWDEPASSGNVDPLANGFPSYQGGASPWANGSLEGKKIIGGMFNGAFGGKKFGEGMFNGSLADHNVPIAVPSREVAAPKLPFGEEEIAAPKFPFGHPADTLFGESGSGTEWRLPSKILELVELPSQDGCIWKVDKSAALPEKCRPLVVTVGPLVDHSHSEPPDQEETKLKYAHNLIRRAHQDVKKKLTAYLTHVSLMVDQIRQRYDPSEYRATARQLVETMVLDGLFIIEVLINHWTGKIDQGSTSLQEEKKDSTTPKNLRWELNAIRLDLIVVQNQIPFFVLEELFSMTDIPELREGQKQPSKLKQIILDYLIGDADDALAGYQGPVYHILHLVYLHLTFSKAQHQHGGSALHPNTVPRAVSVNWALDKMEHKAMDLRAFFKRTFSRSSNLSVGWKQWKVIPPLRELVRVGVKLKRAETDRFAEIKFKNGVLEIPPFAWRRYHIRLLTNLVVLEMSGWWPPEKRIFCSYVRFMAELITRKEDATLLFEKGIVQEIHVDDIEKSLVYPFLILSQYSHGSKYECRFDGLVRDMVKCYQTWNRVGAVRRSGR